MSRASQLVSAMFRATLASPPIAKPAKEWASEYRLTRCNVYRAVNKFPALKIALADGHKPANKTILPLYRFTGGSGKTLHRVGIGVQILRAAGLESQDHVECRIDPARKCITISLIEKQDRP